MSISWEILNKFRSSLYGSGINDAASAYHYMIVAQMYVGWAALILFPFALVIRLYEIVHRVRLKVLSKPSA
jgi:hypothetical protein